MAKFTFDRGLLYVAGLDGEPSTKHHVISDDGQPCRFDGTFKGEWGVFRRGCFAILIGCQVYGFTLGQETDESVQYRSGWERAAKQRRKICPKSFASEAERDGWLDCWSSRAA